MRTKPGLNLIFRNGDAVEIKSISLTTCDLEGDILCYENIEGKSYTAKPEKVDFVKVMYAFGEKPVPDLEKEDSVTANMDDKGLTDRAPMPNEKPELNNCCCPTDLSGAESLKRQLGGEPSVCPECEREFDKGKGVQSEFLTKPYCSDECMDKAEKAWIAAEKATRESREAAHQVLGKAMTGTLGPRIEEPLDGGMSGMPLAE